MNMSGENDGCLLFRRSTTFATKETKHNTPSFSPAGGNPDDSNSDKDYTFELRNSNARTNR